MKCILLFIFTILIMQSSFSQDHGIHFNHESHWNQIIAQATKEHKRIFVDCYTTWCGPCKAMVAQVFPMKIVGDFYNQNFICYKAQIDTTILDNDEVKKHYSDNGMLCHKYDIQLFPTYLYFSPEGELVYRSAGFLEPEKFIEEGKNALDSNKSFNLLQNKYNAGNKSPELIHNLAEAAIKMHDKNADIYTRGYFRTQSNIFTKENIKFLRRVTRTTSDTGFTIVSANEEAFDKATTKGAARKFLVEIIDYSTFENLNVLYETNKGTVNWAAYETNVTTMYPKYGHQVALTQKVTLLERAQKWNDMVPAAIVYYNAFPEACEPQALNSWAWNAFVHCDNTDLLKKMLPLSKASFEKDNNPEAMDTYANLLYKTGSKDQAIEWETKAMNLASTDKDQYQKTIDKMKAGEKTWENQ